jgi:hypothetical protein
MTAPESPERYWILFLDSSHDLLFEFSTADGPPSVDLPAVRAICDPIRDPCPEIVYSLEMGPYAVDVASCLDLLCASVVDRSTLARTYTTSLSPLALMMILGLHPALDFTKVAFPPNPVELCFQLFTSLCDPALVPYYSLVSSDGNIYATFGSIPGLDSKALWEGWQAVLGVLEDFEDGLFVLADDCPYAAVVDFMPRLKLCVFFNEPALKNTADAALAFHQRAQALVPGLCEIFGV